MAAWDCISTASMPTNAAMAPSAPAEEGLRESAALHRLREQLTANRRKLSRVLYELGRGFVLMGLSADFSREVAKEPVPVPDMAMRGRNLLDEVARARQALRVPLAQGALVAVEHGEGQVLHVHADAVADHDHQHQRAHQGQRGAHRVAL